jgi:hypothetical protein
LARCLSRPSQWAFRQVCIAGGRIHNVLADEVLGWSNTE